MLSYFFDDYFEYTIKFSSIFAEKRYKTRVIFSKEDFYKYIFFYLYVSIYNFPKIDMLWEKSILISSIIPNIITKGEYKNINKYFYISTFSDLINPMINKNNKIEIKNLYVISSIIYGLYLILTLNILQ